MENGLPEFLERHTGVKGNLTLEACDLLFPVLLQRLLLSDLGQQIRQVVFQLINVLANGLNNAQR